MGDESIRRDFDRNVWCLLGLTFDAVGIDDAIASIYDAADSRCRLFISTPNLNFTIAALDDVSFRNTVYGSDLSLLDGMPLLWIARLFGTELCHKVSGSDLFQQLWLKPQPESERLKVFFFGGKEGVAEKACQSIARQPGNFECVGHIDPGFGALEELSEQDFIDKINRSGADFLVLALGARKGQFWIEENLEHLEVPVISHLGAVLNFVAGTVKRAPVWMQRSGLEWAWRVYEEPSLWRRYFADGIRFIWLIVYRVLPYVWWRWNHADLLREVNELKPDIVADTTNEICITPGNACLYETIGPLRQVFADAVVENKNIILDLRGVPVVDGAFLGLCLQLKSHQDRNGRQLRFVNANDDVRCIFRWNCVEYLI